jgi:transcriptional regulator with XRE-family HTH domain
VDRFTRGATIEGIRQNAKVTPTRVEFAVMDTVNRAMSAEDRYRAAAGAVFGRLRQERGWSFRDFGEKVGAAHTTLYAVERGETTPGIDLLDRVATVFGLNLIALLALIIDELAESGPEERDSLPHLVVSFSRLKGPQRAEALRYIEYLQYRDDGVRTD